MFECCCDVILDTATRLTVSVGYYATQKSPGTPHRLPSDIQCPSACLVFHFLPACKLTSSLTPTSTPSALPLQVFGRTIISVSRKLITFKAQLMWHPHHNALFHSFLSPHVLSLLHEPFVIHKYHCISVIPRCVFFPHIQLLKLGCAKQLMPM